jgi:hypothetical protein
MKNIFILLVLVFSLLACDKYDEDIYHPVNGTWKLQSINGGFGGINNLPWTPNQTDKLIISRNKFSSFVKERKSTSGTVYIDTYKGIRRMAFRVKKNEKYVNNGMSMELAQHDSLLYLSQYDISDGVGFVWKRE